MNTSRLIKANEEGSRVPKIVAIFLAAGFVGIAVSTTARAQTVTACVNTKTGAVALRSKGTCPKGTATVVLNPPTPTTLKVQTLTAQTINVVDSGNNTVATLGKNANGNLLRFLDGAGHLTLSLGNNANETFAGIAMWDGNNVIPGNGIPRETIGASNPNVGPVSGFGLVNWDGGGNVRSGIYLAYDGTSAGAYADSINGSTTGFGENETFQDMGFYAYDLNGNLRSSVGQTLDGSVTSMQLYDQTGALRTGIRIPSGAEIGYFNQDANGTGRISLYESADGLVTSLSLLHQSGIEGADAIANDEPGSVGSGFATWNADHTYVASILGVGEPEDTGYVDTYNSGGVGTGHLP